MSGVAREWSALLTDPPGEGDRIELRLVMTKFAPPDVKIAYEIRLENAR